MAALAALDSALAEQGLVSVGIHVTNLNVRRKDPVQAESDHHHACAASVRVSSKVP